MVADRVPAAATAVSWVAAQVGATAAAVMAAAVAVAAEAAATTAAAEAAKLVAASALLYVRTRSSFAPDGRIARPATTLSPKRPHLRRTIRR